MKRVAWLLMLFCVSGALAVHAAAPGTLVGTATDQDGRPIAHANIRLFEVISGKQLASAGARADGSYVINNVPEGIYYLNAHAPGCEPLLSKTVSLKTGEVVPLDLVFRRTPSWFSSNFSTALALWGVFFSVFLTFGWPRLHAWLYRPKLALEVSEKPPYSHWINPQIRDKDGRADNINIYFCRVNIRNTGKTEAEQVDVTVRRVSEYGAGWFPIKRFVPLNLRWSNTWDIQRAGEDVPGDARILVKDRISAGGERLCDLGFVVDPKCHRDFCERANFRDLPDKAAPDPASNVRFQLAFEFIRDIERHRLLPGRYSLEIVVDAIRIEPKSFWVELQIPDLVRVPTTGKEREQDLAGFQIKCHQEDPAARRSILSALAGHWRRFRSALANWD